jgi:hypothetical protein
MEEVRPSSAPKRWAINIARIDTVSKGLYVFLWHDKRKMEFIRRETT